MFHFPTFPPTTLCVQVEVAGHYSGFFRGFPIRRSPDRSSFTSSPGLIAGYNVLHRLLVPRHPPIALSSLLFHYKDARVHCEVLNITGGPRADPTCARCRLWSAEVLVAEATEPSGPNSVLWVVAPWPRGSTPPANRGCTDEPELTRLNGQCSTFRCLLGPRTYAVEPASWTGRLGLPMGSLERR